MLLPQQVEDLVCLLSSLDRATLVEVLRTQPAPFAVDFSEEFLRDISLDRLRHYVLALCLHTQQMPLLAAEAA